MQLARRLLPCFLPLHRHLITAIVHMSTTASASASSSTPARAARSSRASASSSGRAPRSRLGDSVPRTADGHHVIIDGRKWRASDPSLPPEQRQMLVNELMSARRAVGAALRASDSVAEKAARARVHAAKVALGERGPKWWEGKEGEAKGETDDAASGNSKDDTAPTSTQASTDDLLPATSVPAAAAMSSPAASSDASAAAAAASAPAVEVGSGDSASLFTPVRAPVRRSGRKRGGVEDAPAAAPVKEEAAASAPVKGEDMDEEPKPEKQTKAKRQKKEHSDTDKDDVAAPMTVDEPPAASAAAAPAAEAAASSSPSSSSAAAASPSDTTQVVTRASPDVLSFPASLLTQPVSAYGAAFDRIARDLLLDYELHANGHVLRLLEIEFYWRQDPEAAKSAKEGGHVDLFAHASPVQLNNYGNWYWHRQGTKPDASYKGGNYKGLDVTIGAVGGGGHGGILIRAVQRVSDGVVFEGSCLVAEEVLRMHGGKSIVEVVAGWKGNTSAFTNPTLFFAPAAHRLPAVAKGAPVIVRSPRVGLTLKQSGESRQHFIMLPYRYCRCDVPGFVNKKMKQTIMLSIYEELGPGCTEVLKSLCGATPSYQAQHIAAYDAGKKLADLSKFVGGKDMNAEAMAQMYGAWMKKYGGKHTAFLRA